MTHIRYQECLNCYFTNCKDLPTDCKKYPKQEKEIPLDIPENISFQVGGNHYSKLKIQPIDYIVANELGYSEGNVVKYITRHPYKNGAEDIRKAKQYCDFILKYTYGEEP